MTPERWQHVERLYHSALALQGPARAAFLAEACSSDVPLRQEVESLLAHASASGLDASIEGLAAPPVGAPSPSQLVGRQLGDYRIEALLAAGGMGTVYRARDTRLGRDVAVKVLPPAFAGDRERGARFEREARLLATLHHANIAIIHGVVDTDDVKALVMELVDGETLAHRLERLRASGRRLGVGETLALATQLADALDAAHEQRIVHRDLKPANIMITPAGVLKVLDFGLARGDTEMADADAVERHQTRPGAILGTATYMSPEQARGLPIDKRTDIWAFGCIVYEMLCGRPPFDGPTMSDVIAGILERAVDFEALPPDTPAPVRRLLTRCLEKDRQLRLRDIGDARADLGDATIVGGRTTAPRPDARVRRWPGAAALVAAAGISGALVWATMQPAPSVPAAVSRFTVAVPPSMPLAVTPYRDVAISPDGSRFAYRTTLGLVVRARDGSRSAVLPLDSGSVYPFFSPDGQWIGFTSGGSVRKVSVSGGAPITVATASEGVVGSWGPDGIIFADVNGLFRVQADGGQPEPLPMQPLNADEQATFPEPLPDGRTVLITVIATRTSAVALSLAEAPGARVEAVDVRTGARTVLVRGGGAARYVAPGYLVYAAEGRQHVVAFDAARMAILGRPTPVNAEDGTSNFAVSAEGSVLYVAGGARWQGLDLVWVDANGREEGLGAPPRSYVYPEISPDGTRVALVMGGSSRADRDVWMWDLRRRVLEQLFVDPSDNSTIAWTLDGRRLAFGSARNGGIVNTFWQAVDGSGEASSLQTSTNVQMPATFANDGRLLLSVQVPDHGRDIVAMTVDGSGRTEPILHGPANELSVDVSPDGRWLAYDSNESGQFEIYVRPYPNADQRRWAISTGGGRQPVWSRDGRRLFYRDFSGAMIAVEITLTNSFTPGPPSKLFDGHGFLGGGSAGSSQTYDVADDGRFLMIKQPALAEPSLVLVQNWTEELKRLVPRQ